MFVKTFVLISLGVASIQNPLTVKPTGSVWPLPRQIVTRTNVYQVVPSQLFFHVDESDCDLVVKAVRRYQRDIFVQREVTASGDTPLLTHVRIRVVNWADCLYPYQNMDEEYAIDVSDGNATIEAVTPWGALRGLETFSQLIYVDATTKSYLINSTRIVDYPRYNFRGVLLDTSRHYLSMRVLKMNLDAMAFNKLNAFHWHIVDDQSWPLQLETFPNLTQAAYDQRLIYTKEDIKEIVEYARERGIRVIPEIDTPGHSKALATVMPGIMANCPPKRENLDPTNPAAYDTVTKMVQELHEIFPDEYFHLGMDEVSYSCWENSPDIKKWMTKNGITSFPQLEQLYVNKTLDNVRRLGIKYMIWQDPLSNGVQPAPDTLVFVWLDKYGKEWKEVAANITKKGYPIILATPWYLNRISYGEDWINFYNVEPTEFPATAAESILIKGGEACMWGEWVDGTNVLARLWPRASAVAERLWSDISIRDITTARIRLNEHRCRMIRRNLPAEPLGPGSCGAHDWV